MAENKYQLEDYMELLQECFGDRCQIDIATNKVRQSSVRLRYQVNKTRSFEMFIFENGFAVSYKPNGSTHIYEHITPKQARAIVSQIVRYIER